MACFGRMCTNTVTDYATCEQCKESGEFRNLCNFFCHNFRGIKQCIKVYIRLYKGCKIETKCPESIKHRGTLAAHTKSVGKRFVQLSVGYRNCTASCIFNNTSSQKIACVFEVIVKSNNACNSSTLYAFLYTGKNRCKNGSIKFTKSKDGIKRNACILACIDYCAFQT